MKINVTIERLPHDHFKFYFGNLKGGMQYVSRMNEASIANLVLSFPGDSYTQEEFSVTLGKIGILEKLRRWIHSMRREKVVREEVDYGDKSGIPGDVLGDGPGYRIVEDWVK